MAKSSRQNARAHGLWAEWWAMMFLRSKGYRILARNYTIPGGEIDIIARRGDNIAFVEVKARATLDQALGAIDASKRRRMSRAAAHWLSGKDWALACTLRGDALCILPWRWPRHVVAAVNLRIG